MNKYNLILTILICSAGCSCQQKNDVEAKINRIMHTFIEESIAPGMGLGYYSDKTGTIMFAIGESDKEKNIPLKTSTHYPIQSTTKMFMSILTLQLIEEGKVKLESTIDEWVDYVPNNSEITIRHLLTHTSGLKNYMRNSDFMDEYFSETKKEYTRNDLICAGLEVSHDGKIGNKEYSNTNLLILADIIETISHQSISQALEHDIFRPADMNHTYFKPGIITDTTSIVNCYRFGESIDLDKWNFLANTGGGIVSTIEDMLKFAQWLIDNNYHLMMSQESELIDLYESSETTSRYGLGIEVDDKPSGVRIMGHSGGNPGLIHEFRFLPESGQILVYYVNEGRVGSPFGEFMREMELILEENR